jgi:adenosylcobinamide-phosphate synthase
VAGALIAGIAAHPSVLAAAFALDLALGDPVYSLHPIRLMGRSLAAFERALRAIGADGYGGGIALFFVLATFWVAIAVGLANAASAFSAWFGWAVQLFLVYSLLALGDLIRHVWRVERALDRHDLPGARTAVSQLVGRDTASLDAAACRRAAIESLSENLTDGVTSPIVWYAALGLAGIVLFKVVSTMDSMVGYKTDRYRRFGWCGARLDDAMNYLPARLTWLFIAAVAAVWPRCSAAKAIRVGWAQHGVLLGPNSGWSEAAAAGAIQRRIVGPVFLHGTMVTDAWIGDPADPAAGTRDDLTRAIGVVTASGVASAAAAMAIAALWA